METTTNFKSEIITLLLADLRSRKLLFGLEQAGLAPDSFYTGLHTVILSKMGFEIHSDALLNWYEDVVEQLLDMDLPYFMNKEHDLALQLYEQLVWKKLNCQIPNNKKTNSKRRKE